MIILSGSSLIRAYDSVGERLMPVMYTKLAVVKIVVTVNPVRSIRRIIVKIPDPS